MMQSTCPIAPRRILATPLMLAVALAGLLCSGNETFGQSAFTQMLLKKQNALSAEKSGNRPAPIPFAAVDGWKPDVKPRDWKHIVIHHTATDAGSVASIHRAHLQRVDAAGNPWRGIGYHFLIGNGNGMVDGKVEATFRWDDQSAGAHAGDVTYNEQGIGICLVGNFEEKPPTAAQLRAVEQLVATLRRDYRIPAKNVVGHGDVKSTRCPGKLFPLDRVAKAETGQTRTAARFLEGKLLGEDAPAPTHTR